jgi:hypothetical protein
MIFGISELCLFIMFVFLWLNERGNYGCHVFLSHLKVFSMIKRFLSKKEIIEIWIPVAIGYGFIAIAIAIVEYGKIQ